MVRGPGAPRIAAVQHQSRDTRGIRRGEQERHWSSLGDAEERGSLAAHGIHHGPHVIHPLLERRDAANAIGEPRPALVEPDEPRERAQALEEAGRPRMLPLIFQVRHEAGDDDEAERPASRHLVGDVQTAALCVLSLGCGSHDAPHRLWARRSERSTRLRSHPAERIARPRVSTDGSFPTGSVPSSSCP
jgi:hypothetical protein